MSLRGCQHPPDVGVSDIFGRPPGGGGWVRQGRPAGRNGLTDRGRGCMHGVKVVVLGNTGPHCNRRFVSGMFWFWKWGRSP